MKTTIISLITTVLVLILSSTALANNAKCVNYFPPGTSAETYIQVADNPGVFDPAQIDPSLVTLSPQAQRYLCSINPAFSFKLSQLTWEELAANIQAGLHTSNSMRLATFYNTVSQPQITPVVSGKGRKTRQAQAKLDERVQKNNDKTLKRIQKDLDTLADRSRDDQASNASRMMQLIDRGFSNLNVWVSQKQDYADYYLSADQAARFASAEKSYKDKLDNAFSNQTNSILKSQREYDAENLKFSRQLEDIEDKCADDNALTPAQAELSTSVNELDRKLSRAKKAVKKLGKKAKKSAKTKANKTVRTLNSQLSTAKARDRKLRELKKCVTGNSRGTENSINLARITFEDQVNIANATYAAAVKIAENEHNTTMTAINLDVTFNNLATSHMFENMNNQLTQTQEDTNYYADRYIVEQSRLIEDSYENAKRFISDLYDLED